MPGGIIALDLASRLGWATWQPDGTVRHGAHSIARVGAEDGAFFGAYSLWLSDMITVERPESLCFEAPWIGPDTAQQTAYRLMGLAAITDMTAYLREIPRVRQVNNASVRKHFTGVGRAARAEMKRLVTRACLQRGWQPIDDNAADALAVLDFAMHCFRVPGAIAGPLMGQAHA